MNIKAHSIAQILATVLQGLNMFGGMVPAKYQPFVAFALTVVQGGIALMNHYYSPDGTKLPVPLGKV